MGPRVSNVTFFNHGVSGWIFMVPGWFFMVFHDFSWLFMVFTVPGWFFMVFHGFRSVLQGSMLGFHGCRLVFIVVLWFIVFHGSA